MAEEEKKNILEKIKAINIKNVVRTFVIIWGFVLIVVMTITNIGFDEHFSFIKWLSNSLIIFGIIVFGLLMGESWGKDNRKHDEKGLYKRSLNDFEDLLDKYQNEMTYFGQYYTWELDRENKSKKTNFLLSTGMSYEKAKLIIDELSINDLNTITNHPMKVNGGIIRKLEEHEVESVKQVLEGKIKVDADSVSYFLSAYDEDSTHLTENLETGKKTQKQRDRNRKSHRIIKIASSLGISLVIGALAVKDFVSGSDTQAWTNLVSRIFALFTSFFSGWLSGTTDVKLQAIQLIGKIKVINNFHYCLTEKIFVPLSEKELAEKELAQDIIEKKYCEVIEQEQLPVIEYSQDDTNGSN